MSSQKYDSKTRKKLAEQYKEVISKYSPENMILESQINDLKTTLNLNQELLYHSLTSISNSGNKGDSDKLKNMVEKCKDLWNKNESLIETKNQVEINIDKLKKAIDEAPSLIRDEINNISVLNNKKKTELMLKENVIKKLKADLEKTRKNAFFKTARTEVLVTEPTKTSLEINQDLLIAKTILSKVSNMHSKEKKRSNKLEREAKNLREEMNKLKKKAINLYISNLNKNEIQESTKSISDENNFLANLGYNLAIENSNKDDGELEEEEKEESEESSEEETSEENDDKGEEKSKELEKLNEQYNKLKDKIDEYQKQINQYKEEYKDLKNKMEKLKNIKPENGK